MRCWLFLFCEVLCAHSFVFVHIGERLPPYLPQAIRQVRLFNPTCPVYLVANRCAFWEMPAGLLIQPIVIESLQKSENHRNFERKTLHRGFWKYATERFFYLEELIRQEALEDVFHLENDVMLYFDVEEKLKEFHEFYSGKIGAVFDNDARCIPGFVYISGLDPLERLVRFIAERGRERANDMELLAQFKDATDRKYIDHLPLIPTEYGENDWLQSKAGHAVQDARRFSLHFEAFDSIFDGAAWGQFLGGIDPIHGSSEPGFINESAIFNPALFSFEWRQDKWGRQIPYGIYGNRCFRINNLHIHSKRLAAFNSLNEQMPLPR